MRQPPHGPAAPLDHRIRVPSDCLGDRALCTVFRMHHSHGEFEVAHDELDNSCGEFEIRYEIFTRVKGQRGSLSVGSKRKGGEQCLRSS